MPRRQNLPLNGLRAFEAAARHESFSGAADELFVTHGAISQQILRLESQLGLALFHRHNRGVRLTDAGAALLPVLCDSFDNISSALENLVHLEPTGGLKVTTTPFFASRWLLPRLNRWRHHHPDLAVELRPSLDMLDIVGGECDIAIRCGVPPWPGLRAELLLPIHLSPLCSPNLLAGDRELKSPTDLKRFDLIHADTESHVRGEEWKMWLSAAGEREVGEPAGLHFHEPALALQAAADGLGIAMGYLEFAQDDLASGRLVQPFNLCVRHTFSYYLVQPEKRRKSDDLQSFITWIRGEAASTER